MSAFTTLPIDPVTGAVGRRPSGARLYHRDSRFGPPERRKLDRNLRVRILHLAIALENRTRQPGQHGGVLKRTGVDVLRALLFEFLNMTTGECFPSLEQIAGKARCCVETVRKAIRALEAAGIIETVRRKVVASFTSRVHRVRFDVAVQTSNSYIFNTPLSDRPIEGDLGLPLLRSRSEADAKFQYETTQTSKKKAQKGLSDEAGPSTTPAQISAKARRDAALVGADPDRIAKIMAIKDLELAASLAEFARLIDAREQAG